MTLKDSIKADSSAIFLNVDEFAESVVYKPRNGGARTIYAIVDRDPPAVYDAAGNVVLPAFRLSVRNSCTLGISSKELDTGGDSVELVRKLGDAVPVTVSIMRMAYQDEGVVEIDLM